MRRIITLILALTLATGAFAEKPRTAYCGLSASGLCYGIDYGQSNKRRNWIVDDDGNNIYFHSEVDMLNYMSERGWCLVLPYMRMSDGDSTNTLWLFSKEVCSEEEVTAGITTRQMIQERMVEEADR